MVMVLFDPVVEKVALEAKPILPLPVPLKIEFVATISPW